MDSTHAANTKRIAKNTLFLYGRMLFGMLVSLYTSRLVLNALGVDDFGIYGVVGGLVAMFSLISSSLQSAVSRFITFELGANNMERLKRTFSTAFVIQAILAVLVLFFGETLGVWFLNTKMVIPPDRLFAANVVFQASIFSFMLGLLLMPYYACINAHEKMDIYAYMSLLDIFLRLGLVIFIAFSPLHFDRLIVYSVLLVVIGMIMQAIAVAYCRRKFEETKVRWHLDREFLKSMSGFAGWNFIGCAAGLFRDQGGNILLNLFFGPAVNAARGVAGSVSGAIGGLTGNFLSAVNPQITKSFALGDLKYMHSLIFKASRFGSLMMMMIGLPIVFNVDYILKLWLGIVPPDSGIFVVLVMIFCLLETISNPLINAQLATGNIKNYQIVVGGLLCLTFPASWLVLWLGSPAYSIFIVSIVTSVICLFARLFFLRGMIGLKARMFLKNTVAKCLVVLFLSCIAPYFILKMMEPSFERLVISTIITEIVFLPVAFFLGCDKSERDFMTSKLVGLKFKLSSL